MVTKAVVSAEDKARKHFEQWAMEVVLKLQDILLLQDYAPVTIKPMKVGNSSLAEVECSYPYKSISISYSKELFESWRKGEVLDVRSILTHEMCHPLTDPLYAKATYRFVGKNEIEDERERLTDHFANIIIKSKLI